MKRYFLVHDDHMPTIKQFMPGMNYIELDSHGEAGHLWNLVTLEVDDVAPRPEWIAFPPLIDSKTTLAASAVDHELLADLGLTGEETCLEAAVIFGAIHPAVAPYAS